MMCRELTLIEIILLAPVCLALWVAMIGLCSLIVDDMLEARRRRIRRNGP